MSPEDYGVLVHGQAPRPMLQLDEVPFVELVKRVSPPEGLCFGRKLMVKNCSFWVNYSPLKVPSRACVWTISWQEHKFLLLVCDLLYP